MAPRCASDEIFKLLITLSLTRLFLLLQEIMTTQRRGQPADEMNALEQSLYVLISAFFERMEIDVRQVSGIPRPQCYLSRPVSRVPLQDRPGQLLQILPKLPCVSWVVALKMCQQCHAKKIGRSTTLRRLSEYA